MSEAEIKNKLSWAVKQRDAAKKRNDKDAEKMYVTRVVWLRQQLQEVRA